MPPIRVAIIGAGPCGLTSAKALAEAGITDLVMFDRGQRVGGNWVFDDASGHSSVFETTHIISSRRYSSFSDHAFPEGTPDYPSHREVAAYFESYAERFDLHRYLRPSTLVLRCTPRPEGGFVVRWRSEIDHSEHEEAFDKLVVANGHHWLPRWPDYPGTFSGEVLHSHDYKRAAPFTGRRVLVIGGGNSACDIAVETSRVSERTEISWRRGYWIVPKFVFGWAADDLNHAIAQRLGWIPLAWRLKALEVAVKLLTGGHGRYGLAAPDHPLGATHPTVNSELLYALRHGKITPRPDIERLDGSMVHFVNGSSAEFDTVIAATGYKISHPFFDPDFIDFSEGPVPLYLKMLHPERDDLAFVGLFQPLGCIWPCAELQARLIARWWTGRWRPPADLNAEIRREISRPHLRQLPTPRHSITVDEIIFRRRLLLELGPSTSRPETSET